MTEHKNFPACFAKLSVVFPENKDGFRQSPDSCFLCYYKTACLKKAMEGIEGLEIKEKVVDRAYDNKLLSFVERWSRKKHLNRLKEETEAKNG